ncbi:hypothetical protein FALCPG4_015444 [Fusarium falciforme]
MNDNLKMEKNRSVIDSTLSRRLLPRPHYIRRDEAVILDLLILQQICNAVLTIKVSWVTSSLEVAACVTSSCMPLQQHKAGQRSHRNIPTRFAFSPNFVSWNSALTYMIT